MLKKSLIKKLFIILSALFILFILYLFPRKGDEISFSESNNRAMAGIIYLINSNNFVSRVTVAIRSDEPVNQAKEIIEYLTIGTRNAGFIKNGFSPIIPEGTRILSIDFDNGLLKINFSKEFYEISADNEEQMISAIVFSLTTIEGINQISIYIEDSILNELPHSKKPVPPTIDRSFGVNRTYNISNISGTVATTIYYLSRFEDYLYFVPVTMINNHNEKDPIEIIIRELTSRTMYQTNLISYLNNIQDIDFEVGEDFLLIKLNNELYQDLNSAHLIERVIYSMNLSIKENYNITTVLYMVNDIIVRSFFLY